jgi:hypothetical protein
MSSKLCLCCGGRYGQGKGSDCCAPPFLVDPCILFDQEYGRCWASKELREKQGNCKGVYQFDWRGLTEWGLTTA